MVPFIDQSEYLSGLLDDPRIDDVASDLLGEDYNYTGSDGNFYVGDTRWHSDGYARSKYRNIKFAFYLDPVDRDTGCLRVIPGSHHRGDDYAEGLQEHYVKPAGLDDGGARGRHGSRRCRPWRWRRVPATC